MKPEEIYEILGRAYFSENCHEKEVVENLHDLLEEARLFVDLGASLGQYTYHANRVMRGGEIIAVEADPVRFARLEESCAAWQEEGTNRLTAVHAAVGDSDGETPFFVTNSTISGALFPRDVTGSQREAEWQEVTVPCVRLDTLLGGRCPDAVKIDVEGAELRVLQGAANVLERGETKFLIELHSMSDPQGQGSPQQVVQFLQSYGYAKRHFHGRPLFVKS